MKPVSIHPLSALAGAGLLGLILVASGAAQTRSLFHQIPTGSGTVRVAGIPDPRDMLVIREGTPFVVPQGKLLVVTALGATANSVTVNLMIDGQREAQGVVNMPTFGPTTMAQLPMWLTIGSGATVEAVTGSIYGRAWGYLVDA